MGRGLSSKTLSLISHAYEIANARQPISVRGIAYQMFTRGLIPDMSVASTKLVSRVLTTAREQGLLPWGWIVDEHREIERPNTWAHPAQFAEAVRHSYRRDRWTYQAKRVLVMSEKGTVGGILQPVLYDYGVPFLVAHGFSSATVMKALADESVSDLRPLTILYVGDYDPSGRFMSDVDLPERLDRYGGSATIRRIALVDDQLEDLPSFAVATKRGDKRHDWYVERFGQRCWELDALDPNRLRDVVESGIRSEIDWSCWEQAGVTEAAELSSLHVFFELNPLFGDQSQNSLGGAQ